MNGHDDNGQDGLDRQLDEQLAGYYRPIADAPVPVRLHGRIVRTIQARAEGRRSFRRRPIRILGRLAPAGIAVAVIALIALGSVPLLQHGPAGPNSSGPLPRVTPGPTGAASLALTPLPSGPTSVTIMNRGSARIAVNIDGRQVGSLACGETATYSGPKSGDLVLDIDGLGSPAGNLGMVESGQPWQHYWILYVPHEPDVYTTEPADPGYSLCPKKQLLRASEGLSSAESIEPVISGTRFDADINAAIDAKASAWLHSRRADLAAIGTTTDTIAERYVVDWLRPDSQTILAVFGRMLPITLSYYRMGPDGTATNQLNWSGTLTFDLTDGHVMGIEELFSPSSDWLSVLSAESRKAVGHPTDGGKYAAATAPIAANFENWRPTEEGLSVAISIPMMDASTAQPVFTIPWSVLKPLLRPDSPILAYIPA